MRRICALIVALAAGTAVSTRLAARAAEGAEPHDTANAPTSVEQSRNDAPTLSEGLPETSAAAQAASLESGSFRVGVLSDLNSAYGSLTYTANVHAGTRALVERIRPELVLITGDMVAGQKAGLDYAAMWRGFHAAVTEPLLSSGIAVAPTPGNHDASPGFKQERAEYVAQWSDPARQARVRFVDRSNYPLSYSFEYRGVFFASLDAAAVGPLGQEQVEWLDRQLAQTAAVTKVVFGHLPVYPFAVHREVEILNDDALVEVLSKHAVSAYVSGHHHAYYPGAVDGVRHIAMPCLGSGARRLIGGERVSASALVVLEIEDGRLHSLEAWRAPDFETAIARETLPARIERGRHRVIRDDLAGLQPERSPSAPSPAPAVTALP